MSGDAPPYGLAPSSNRERNRHLLRALRSATTHAEVEAAIEECANALGYEYYFVLVTTRMADKGRVLMVNYPQPWLEEYMREGYLDKDPVATHALTSREPFDWSEVAHSDSEAEQSVMKRAQHHGLHSGVTTSFRGPFGGTLMMSLASTQIGLVRTGDIEFAGLFMYLASNVMGAVKRVVQDGGAPSDPFTPFRLPERKRQVLQLISDGNSLEVTAREVGLSYPRVNQILREIQDSFAVNTREKAIKYAVRLNLID